MTALDLALVLAVVGGAIGFLLWRLRGERRAPACHPWRRPAATDGDVVIGAALARGLRAAEAHRSGARRRRPT